MHTKTYLPVYKLENARFIEQECTLECTIRKNEQFFSVYYNGEEFYLSINDIHDLSNILSAVGGTI